MQLVLELLKKIFIALQGNASSIATNTANIDWLMTAVDGDWKTYMLARAGMTGIQKNIDTVNRAIREYNADNTSALAARLIEDWDVLYWHEFERGIRFDSVFWVAYFEAVARWEADPDGVVDWSTVNNGDGTYTYNCPYHDAPATSPVVELRAVNLRSSEIYTSAMYPTINQPWYTPNTTNLYCAFAATKISAPVIIHKLVGDDPFIYRVFWASDYNQPMYLKTPIMFETFRNDRSMNSKVVAIGATDWTNAFMSTPAFNQAVDMSSASIATSAFSSSGMSAENISKTLDTLPEKTDGVSRPIKFSRYDGTRLAPLMAVSPYAESVNAAIAKGWTVQFDE